MTHLMLNDVVEMTRKRRNRLTDEQILDLAYGIRNADAYMLARNCEVSATRILKIQRELRSRLDAIEAAQPEPQRETVRTSIVVCERCGRKIPSLLAMTSASGTVCPDCYDAAEYSY